MSYSWNFLIQECYHDFSDHASQHRKGDIHQTWSVCHPPCSCHHVIMSSPKCSWSEKVFWLTRPIKPQQIGWNAYHCEWHLKIFNNKQSPNNDFSSSYLYIHTQGEGPPIDIILTQIFTTNLSGRGTLPSWSVCDGSLSPCCSVCHWWGQGDSQTFSWNYEMFVCYCCCKRVEDIMNLSNKLKLYWTAPQKSLPYRAHVSGAPLLLFNI